MKYTLCGIEITQEHADQINATCQAIQDMLYQERKERQLNEVRATLVNNPHNTFQGTAEEYVEKYNLKNYIK
jgi:hypothetical protein